MEGIAFIISMILLVSSPSLSNVSAEEGAGLVVRDPSADSEVGRIETI
jgi:hypothetical protein